MTPIVREQIIIFLSHFQSTRNKMMTKDGKMERSDSFVFTQSNFSSNYLSKLRFINYLIEFSFPTG